MSALALLYPLFGTFGMWTEMPRGASPLLAVGAGIGNLGYVLLVAGVLSGSFRALGLVGRKRVLSVGAAAVVAGIIISNIPQ